MPKALAPINGVPFLQLQLQHWMKQGVDEFIFLLHHQAEQIITFLYAQRNDLLKDCQVGWLVEPTPLGTGGSIAHAVKALELGDNVLVINADTWLGGGIDAMLRSTAPAIAVVNVMDVSRFGQVHFEFGNRVSAFSEKIGHCSPGWISGGLNFLSVELFRDWDGNSFSLELDLFPRLVTAGQLTAVPLQTDFIDIGVPDDYHRFCRWVASDRQGLV